MNPEQHNDSWMSEDALAQTLSVDRSIIKKNRPHAPTGGVRTNGKTVEWNWEAAAELAVKLNLPAEVFQKKTPPAATAAQPEAIKKEPVQTPGIETLTVISKPLVNGRHFANPNLIKCRRQGGDEVFVRVLDSGKYQPLLADSQEPMTVRARKSQAGNWWELMSREPRWRGRP